MSDAATLVRKLSALALIAKLQPRWPAGTPGGHGGEWKAQNGATLGPDKHWVAADGKRLSDADQVRLRALGVPPAWQNVRLNPDPDDDLQVLGAGVLRRTIRHPRQSREDS